MAEPKRARDIPTRCAKCESEQIREAQLTMYGRLGYMGPAYRFDVYICKD